LAVEKYRMLLEVRDLSVRYDPDRRALDGVSFDIAEGQTLGLVGHSGSGKSSTALAIMGLLPKSAVVSGGIRFRGRELLGETESELRRLRGATISMVWQEPSAALNPVLTVGSQIEEVVRAHRAWSAAERRDAVLAILDRVGLGDAGIRGAYPHQLSGGQLQRIVLAQALVCGPALLLADEPAASLDSIARASILRLLGKLRHESSLSMLFITHNEALLPGLADRVIRLQGGRVVGE
jgi:ABC-type glutathione transport system ATPase component